MDEKLRLQEVLKKWENEDPSHDEIGAKTSKFQQLGLPFEPQTIIYAKDGGTGWRNL